MEEVPEEFASLLNEPCFDAELAGQTGGEKERPACIVPAVDQDADGQRVLIVPITTRPPKPDMPAMLISSAVTRASRSLLTRKLDQNRPLTGW